MHEPSQVDFDNYAARYAELLADPIRDRFAPGKLFFAKRKLDLMLGELRRMGADPKSMNWLDIGCGQGDLLRLGRCEFSGSAGSDPSQKMIAFCNDLDVRLQPCSTEIPFDDCQFDLVSVVCVYHHVEVSERPALTAEGVRVLKPGGILAVFEHNPFNPITQLIVSRTPVDENASLLSAGRVRRLLKDSGLSSLATRYFLYMPERHYARFAHFEDRLSRIPLGGQFAVFGRKA